MIVALPGLIPLTTPAEETTATDGSLVVHATDALIGLPLASRAVAVIATVQATFMDTGVGATVTLATEAAATVTSTTPV
jgi:hypothetical protein